MLTSKVHRDGEVKLEILQSKWSVNRWTDCLIITTLLPLVRVLNPLQTDEFTG